MAELAFRSRRILYAAVTEYIATGEPVGSRKLARRYGLDVSPATIRNELADLEESGYLAQPHTSAGRIPTDKGFRAFVDALVRVREVQPATAACCSRASRSCTPGIDDLPREAGRLLSRLTGLRPSVHTPPRLGRSTSRSCAGCGCARASCWPWWSPARAPSKTAWSASSTSPTPQELERLHNYLESLLGERTLSELRDAGGPRRRDASAASSRSARATWSRPPSRAGSGAARGA